MIVDLYCFARKSASDSANVICWQEGRYQHFGVNSIVVHLELHKTRRYIYAFGVEENRSCLQEEILIVINDISNINHQFFHTLAKCKKYSVIRNNMFSYAKNIHTFQPDNNNTLFFFIFQPLILLIFHDWYDLSIFTWIHI